jgi:NAD(P)-dependent dehydrogenase (short-subunit alcohol dehydrogenase family)
MTTDTGRVWLITGCSSGFGAELATAALAAGDRVVATARRPETLADLVAQAPDRALALALDVTDEAAITTAVGDALAHFGRIDVLVNNAGYGAVGAVEEFALTDLRTLMDTMFFGAIALTQAVLPHLRAQGSGTIVQMSSMGGQMTAPGFGPYCAAKFALEAMSEALAGEVAPLGIRVVIVEPGSFRTAFAGDRLHRAGALDAYADTVGQTRAFMAGQDGTQAGDPAKAAAAVVAIVAAPEAPLRLALGEDAVQGIGAALDARRAELDAWAATSATTDFG